MFHARFLRSETRRRATPSLSSVKPKKILIFSFSKQAGGGGGERIAKKTPRILLKTSKITKLTGKEKTQKKNYRKQPPPKYNICNACIRIMHETVDMLTLYM